MRIYKKWCKFGIRFVLVLLFTSIFGKLESRWIYVNLYNYSMIYQTPEVVNMELQMILQHLVAQEEGTGCEMPNLDPFSEEVRRFDKDVKAVSCDGDDWVECHFSKCNVKKPIMNQMRDLTCIYKDIIYVNDDSHYLEKAIRVKGNGKYLLNMSDYVKVSCTGIEVNSSRLLRWQGRKAGFHPVTLNEPHKTSLNVFMLIIDSTSRNTFIRRLPISYKVLKNELRAVVMKGYNIVGESTAGALWPILTGHNEFEVADSIKRPTNTRRVDPKPFLFTLLNKYGYRTAFFEDMPWYHTFNYRFNGFEKMPANHYMRPLFQDIGWNHEKNWTDRERYCFGSESLFKFMVEYSAELLKMNAKKFCVTLSGTFSHDNINAITTVDEDLAHFLKTFKSEGHLEDTLLFVMGDHGSRFSALRNSYQGRIEEYLPFVSIVLPKKLNQERPKALHKLIANSKMLTTPFDLHTTILDALGLKIHRNMYKVAGANLERGMSFLEPIPESRSCGEAGIIPHFCACAKWQTVSANDMFYTKVAWELARFINRITAQNRHKCAKRDLLSIQGVYFLGPMIDLHEFTTKPNTSDGYDTSRGHQTVHHRLRGNLEYYQAKIIMDPGEAIFEGSLQYNVKDDSFSIYDRDISRIDRYGDEPWCVSGAHPHLNKYCYCIGK